MASISSVLFSLLILALTFTVFCMKILRYPPGLGEWRSWDDDEIRRWKLDYALWKGVFFVAYVSQVSLLHFEKHAFQSAFWLSRWSRRSCLSGDPDLPSNANKAERGCRRLGWIISKLDWFQHLLWFPVSWNIFEILFHESLW